jgi:hypothetical protein
VATPAAERDAESKPRYERTSTPGFLNAFHGRDVFEIEDVFFSQPFFLVHEVLPEEFLAVLSEHQFISISQMIRKGNLDKKEKKGKCRYISIIRLSAAGIKGEVFTCTLTQKQYPHISTR